MIKVTIETQNQSVILSMEDNSEEIINGADGTLDVIYSALLGLGYAPATVLDGMANAAEFYQHYCKYTEGDLE